MHPRFECFHNGNYQMLKGRLMCLICQRYIFKSESQQAGAPEIHQASMFDLSKVYNYS